MPSERRRQRSGDDLASLIATFADDEQMWRTLQHNKHLDFVRRALNPSMYPTITNDPRLPAGYGASHQMSAEYNPQVGWMAYPNIVHDRQAGTLNWLSPEQAMAYALTTGEYIPFGSKDAALHFSKKYKRGTSMR